MQFIHEVVGALSKTSCTHIIDFFEENINLSRQGGAGNTPLDDLEIALSFDAPEHNDVTFDLKEAIEKLIGEYKTKFPLINTNLTRWSVYPTCQLMRYEPNKYYGSTHCENDGTYLTRAFAWMIYLNDIKEGGGTHFVHQNFTTQPKCGNFYIWPAGWTHMHHGVPAPKEMKYIITGWVNYL